MNGVTICPGCHGKKTIKCPVCRGTGFAPKQNRAAQIGFAKREACQECQGSGKLVCKMCGGVGKIRSDDRRSGWL